MTVKRIDVFHQALLGPSPMSPKPVQSAVAPVSEPKSEPAQNPFKFCRDPSHVAVDKIRGLPPRVYLHTFTRPIDEIHSLAAVRTLREAHCQETHAVHASLPKNPSRLYRHEERLHIGDSPVEARVFDGSLKEALPSHVVAGQMWAAYESALHESAALFLNARQDTRAAPRFLTLFTTYDPAREIFNIFSGFSDYERRFVEDMKTLVLGSQDELVFWMHRRKNRVAPRIYNRDFGDFELTIEDEDG